MVKIIFDERELESMRDKEGLIQIDTIQIEETQSIGIYSDSDDTMLFRLINPDSEYKHEYIILAFPKDIDSFPKKYKD